MQRFFEQMLNERFDDLSRKPDAKFLGAGIYGGSLSPDVATESLGATVQDGKIRRGSRPSRSKAKRAREFGFGADEMDRASKWMAAFYERAYTERDKTESGSFAQEYLNHFLEGEPSPGIAYEYTARAAAAARHHRGRSLRARPRRCWPTTAASMLAVSPQKPGITRADRSRAEGARCVDRAESRGDGLERHDGDARADRAQARSRPRSTSTPDGRRCRRDGRQASPTASRRG